MSIFEYNEEEEMRKIRASEYKNGKEEGIIETCKDLGLSFEQTVEKRNFGLISANRRPVKKVRYLWDLNKISGQNRVPPVLPCFYTIMYSHAFLPLISRPASKPGSSYIP